MNCLSDVAMKTCPLLFGAVLQQKIYQKLLLLVSKKPISTFVENTSY
jgi:hypothetical protein